MSYDYIDKYNDALAGWTIVSVRKPTLTEGLCEISLQHPTNGKRRSVALGANDLGAWVDWVKDEDGYFKTFEQLANVASDYILHTDMYLEDDDPYTFGRDPKDKGLLVVSVTDGTEWRIRDTDIEDNWCWVLNPTSTNDLSSWINGFAAHMTEDGLVMGVAETPDGAEDHDHD